MIIKTGEVNQIARRIQMGTQDMIPENVEITMEYYKDKFGGSGGSLKCLSDSEVNNKLWKASWNDLFDTDLKDAIDEIKSFCNKFEKLYLSFEKSNVPLVAIYEAEDFVKDIEQELMNEIEEMSYETIEVLVKFDETKEQVDAEVEIVETVTVNGETHSRDGSSLKEDMVYLFYSLKRQPKVLKVTGTKEQIVIESDSSYPDLGIQQLEDIDGLQEDNGKILRYILSNKIGNDYISYSYMNDMDSRRFVDFTGGLVKEHFDIEAYIAGAASLKDEKSLRNYFAEQREVLRQKIKESVMESQDHDYIIACTKLLDMDLKKVMFEKTQFVSANASPVLREYMFFLGMLVEDELYFDIHQSDRPDLTEIYWMLEKVPRTNWSDDEPELPESPLLFHRKGYMRIGDCGEWVVVREK